MTAELMVFELCELIEEDAALDALDDHNDHIESIEGIDDFPEVSFDDADIFNDKTYDVDFQSSQNRALTTTAQRLGTLVLF